MYALLYGVASCFGVWPSALICPLRFITSSYLLAIKMFTDETNGVAEFVGLRENDNTGEYTLEETVAPDGYNKLDGKATFKIEWADPETLASTKVVAAEGQTLTEDQVKSNTAIDEQIANGGFKLTVTQDTTANKAYDIKWNSTDKQFEVTIMNQSGAVLPSTGGIGTTIFYVAGSIMVLAAAILLIPASHGC